MEKNIFYSNIYSGHRHPENTKKKVSKKQSIIFYPGDSSFFDE